MSKYIKKTFGELRIGQGFWWVYRQCGYTDVELIKKGETTTWVDGSSGTCPQFGPSYEVWIEDTETA